MQGKPRPGEEPIVFKATGNQYETSWFDSFHSSPFNATSPKQLIVCSARE